MNSQTAHDIDLILLGPREPLPLFLREFGRLLVESDAWLAVLDHDGGIVCTAGTCTDNERIEDLLAGETVDQVRAALAAAAPFGHSEVRVVRGRTVSGAAIELRIVPAESLDNQFLLWARPVAEAAADRTQVRARRLGAALQAVADIVLTLDELHGHEAARRRASLVATLTDRERLIALAVANGTRTSQIASDLFVSQSTVRNYLPTIYRKLGVRSRAGLVDLLNASE